MLDESDATAMPIAEQENNQSVEMKIAFEWASNQQVLHAVSTDTNIVETSTC